MDLYQDPKYVFCTYTQLGKRESELLTAPYHLMFYDDGADVKQVPAYLVVEHP